MGSPIIFSGDSAKLLKPTLDLNANAKILSGSVDPTSVATSAPKGSIYLNTSTGYTYRKTDAGSSTNWVAMGIGNPNSVFQNKTASFTAAIADDVYSCNTGLGAITVTLPSAVGIAGKRFVFRKITSDFNVVTITAAGAENIDGSASTLLHTVYETVEIVSTGVVWHILDRKIPPFFISFIPTGSWTTNTTYTGYKWREGKFYCFDILVSTAGLPTSANLLINIPDGQTVDTSVQTDITNIPHIYSFGRIYDVSPGQFYDCFAAYDTTTTIRVMMAAGTTYPVYNSVTQAQPITFASGDKVNIKFRVPIVNWNG